MIPQAFAASNGILKSIGDFLPGGIQNLLNLGLGLGAILAFGTIIYAGIIYTASGDNASKQKDARAWIWAAVQGLGLLALGFIIFNAINPKVLQMREIEVPLLSYTDDTPPTYYTPPVSIRSPYLTPQAGDITSPLQTISISGSVYGMRCHPTLNCCRTHGGVDLSAACGSSVYAIDDGKVSTLYDASGYGRYIVIKHPNGTASYYAHLSRYVVGDGADVSKGEKIAESGGSASDPMSGASTGCHLHFELRMLDQAAGTYVTTNVNLLFGVDGQRSTMEKRCDPGGDCPRKSCN